MAEEVAAALEGLAIDDQLAVERIDDELALNRYIWLRSIQPNYTNAKKGKERREVRSTMDLVMMNRLQALDSQKSLVANTFLTKAAQSNCLPSIEESLIIIAYCLRRSDNEELKKLLRSNFVQLIPTAEDLLYFMNYYKQLGNDKLTLARGIRSCLERWYDSKTAPELLEIVFAGRKVKELRHDYLIRKLHLKLEDRDKKEIIRAAFLSSNEIKATAQKSSHFKKINKFQDLRKCTEDHQVVSIIKRKDYQYKLEHLPTIGYGSAEVLEIILPNLTLRDILGNLEAFYNRKFLRVQEPISRKICNALQATKKTIKDEKIRPFYVFEVMKVLELKLTSPECTDHKNENGAKALAPVENKEKDKVVKRISNTFVIKKLLGLLNATLSDQPKTGCRYFITLDIRKYSMSQHRVVGMKNAFCEEVQAILMLALLKNEKDVTVMMFSEDKNKLKPVDLKADTTYEKALEFFDKEAKEKPRTKAVLSLPTKTAAEDKKKVDVFITFVTSLGRAVGNNGKPPIEVLQSYRDEMNLPMTKHIIINLTREKPDLKFTGDYLNTTGILEIVGFSDDSFKIVEAYAKNCFI